MLKRGAYPAFLFSKRVLPPRTADFQESVQMQSAYSSSKNTQASSTLGGHDVSLEYMKLAASTDMHAGRRKRVRKARGRSPTLFFTRIRYPSLAVDLAFHPFPSPVPTLHACDGRLGAAVCRQDPDRLDKHCLSCQFAVVWGPREVRLSKYRYCQHIECWKADLTAFCRCRDDGVLRGTI